MDNMIKLEFLSISSNEAFARAAAASFIASLDPTIEEIADVRTAVSEAVTNAVVHAYPDMPGVVTMELMLNGRTLTVKVADKGCGIEDVELAMQPFYSTGKGGERSGMGFAVMGAFMDKLEVESAKNKGTLVIMQKHLSTDSDECPV